MVYQRILIVVPCAIQKDLVVCFIHHSLHLLIPDSQRVPSATPALLSTSLLICQVLLCSLFNLGKERSPCCRMRVLWSELQIQVCRTQGVKITTRIAGLWEIPSPPHWGLEQ